MRNTAKCILMSCVSVLLVLCMVLSLPLSAQAATVKSTPQKGVTGVSDVNNDGKITYVSFGDSVTNGYGLPGYRYEDGTNTFGFYRETPGSYPALIRDELAEQYGADKVDLKQMAISGYRMEELHAMLDDNYVADTYHTLHFDDWNQSVVERLFSKAEEDPAAKAFYDTYHSQYDGTYASADAIIEQEYRKAVKEADLITIDLGTNNYGTFLVQSLQTAMGMKNDGEIDTNLEQYLDPQTAASMENVLKQLVAKMVGADSEMYDMTYTMMETMLYGFLGFTEHYDGAINAIYEINPNVKIVVIDMYAMISGTDMVSSKMGDKIDLDGFYNLFVDLANFYARELSPYTTKVTHVTLENDPELCVDYYADYSDNKANGQYSDTEYLDPVAYDLMNEFVMEIMGYDPDIPAERTAFDAVLKQIQELDNTVNTIQAVVTKDVIKDNPEDDDDGTVEEGIKEVIENDAFDGVTTAVTGVELINLAVEAVGGPDGNSLIYNASIAIRTAESQVEEGLSDEEHKAAVKEILLKEYADMIPDEQTAEMAYTVGKAYIEAFESGEEHKGAIIAALTAYMDGDATLAENAYNAVQKYNSTYEEVYRASDGSDFEAKKAAKEAALLAAMEYYLQASDPELKADEAKKTAQTAYQLNTAYNTYYNEAMKQEGATEASAEQVAMGKAAIDAMETAVGSRELAEAMYAVYAGTATAAQHKKASIYALMSQTVKDTADSDERTLTEAEATAIYTCYETNEKNGLYNDETVRTALCVLMVLDDRFTNLKDAQDNYDSYLTYKNLPITLEKIAKCKTMYLDKLMAASDGATESEDLVAGMAAKFMNGTLKLDEPVRENYDSDEEYNAAVDEYQSDSTMAIMYFRFMGQDGVFTHPSLDGQKYMYTTASGVLKNLYEAEADSDIEINGETKLLVLGDFIAEGDSYVAELSEKLQVENVTNLSNGDFRINELRALLDSSYARDEYAEKVLAGVDAAQYTAAVEDSDVIVVHLGAMNMAMIAEQLNEYMMTKNTFSMNFATIGNMGVRNLGTRTDNMLSTFESAFTGPDADTTSGAMMLMFETYGYGYTTFADCLDNTIEKIQDLNRNASIVLVGQYDLLGNTSTAGMSEEPNQHFEIGDFVDHALKLMNQHMEIYAEMTDNVTYVDVYSNMDGATDLVDIIMKDAFKRVPDADGYTEMAGEIACHLGAHTPTEDSEIVWGEWVEDDDGCSMTVTVDCRYCGETTRTPAIITVKKDAYCDKDGTITYTASIGEAVCADVKTVTIQATGHSFGDPEWTWTETDDGYTATAVRICANDKTHTITYKDEVKVTSKVETETTCTGAGAVVYTATVVDGDDTFTDTYTNAPAAAGHKPAAAVKENAVNATCAKEGSYEEVIKCSVCNTEISRTKKTIAKLTTHTPETIKGKAATCTATGLTDGSECSVCGKTIKAQEPIPAKGHTAATVKGKAATCTETGLTDGTQCADCGKVMQAQQTIPAKGHSYKDGKCETCGAADPNGPTTPTEPEKPTEPETPAESVIRLYGANRYETAFEVADELKEQMGITKFTSVVVASGTGYADALAGSYLAAEKNAPILLVNVYTMVDVKNYIRENVVKGGTIYLLGGEAAISASMESGMSGYKIQRLAGENRYETNLAILNAAGIKAGDEIMVCTGTGFADSLSASAVGKPILLVRSKLFDSQKAYLKALGTNNKFVIIGGETAVSAAMAEELKAYGTVERVGGANRYETSTALAERFFEAPESAVLAYARKYPDGLCGGPLALSQNAPLILTQTGREDAAVEYATANKIGSGYVLGGDGLISDTSAQKIFGVDKIATK